jgi:hypothetical protein
MENAFPSQNLWRDPCSTFVRTDGVLLKVRNRKEGCCPWSLVATTSHIIALKITTSRRLMIRSLSPLFESLLDFPKRRLHIAHSRPSVLLDSYLPLSHIIVESQVPPYSHFTLIVLLYWPSLSSTLLGVDSLQALSFWSHSCLHVSIIFDLSKRRSPLIALMIASV